jgi:hypothetical protein
VPVRAIWDLRQQGRVPLLQGSQELQGRAQVPLKSLFHIFQAHGDGVGVPLKDINDS